MKSTTNPFQQLQEWKERNKTAQKQAETAKKTESNSMAKVKEKNAQNANKREFYTLPQLNREFYLMKLSASRCKSEFPDNFHFKQTFAKECEDLCQRLKGGYLLLMKLHKQGLISKADLKTFTNFREASGYLNFNLKEIAQQIEQVEQGTAEPVSYEQANEIPN